MVVKTMLARLATGRGVRRGILLPAASSVVATSNNLSPQEYVR